MTTNKESSISSGTASANFQVVVMYTMEKIDGTIHSRDTQPCIQLRKHFFYDNMIPALLRQVGSLSKLNDGSISYQVKLITMYRSTVI